MISTALSGVQKEWRKMCPDLIEILEDQLKAHVSYVLRLGRFPSLQALH